MVKIILFFISLLFSFETLWAQSSTYVSTVDRDLTLNSWGNLPLADNVDGIFARPLNAELKMLMEANSAYRYLDLQTKGAPLAPEEYEERPERAAQLLVKNSIDGFLAGRITKGPRGIQIRLVLFVGKSGLPLIVQNQTDITSMELTDLKRHLRSNYQALLEQLPFRGAIVSRRGNQVTVNIGTSSGIRNGQELLAIQITKVERHPKFQFLVRTEKEIMGKILINKSDEHISFGTITSERTDGQLKSGFKIHIDNFKEYPNTAQTTDGQLIPGLNQQSDADVAFGSNPKEWQPMNSPSFGKVALMLGFGTYAISNNLSTSGSVDASAPLTPSFHVEGEMWLSANWFLGLELHQYVAKISNSLSGSSPSSLELQSLETELVGGYNVFATEEFWGPKMQLMLGMSQMDAKIQDSTPTALTSVKYGGMALGVAGILPIGQETGLPMNLGGKFMYYWNPTLSEAPSDSGSSSSSKISTFSIFGEYQKSPRLGYKGELSFRQYSSNLSGAGSRSESASSINHAMTTLSGGIVFLF